MRSTGRRPTDVVGSSPRCTRETSAGDRSMPGNAWFTRSNNLLTRSNGTRISSGPPSYVECNVPIKDFVFHGMTKIVDEDFPLRDAAPLDGGAGTPTAIPGTTWRVTTFHASDGRKIGLAFAPDRQASTASTQGPAAFTVTLASTSSCSPDNWSRPRAPITRWPLTNRRAAER